MARDQSVGARLARDEDDAVSEVSRRLFRERTLLHSSKVNVSTRRFPSQVTTYNMSAPRAVSSASCVLFSNKEL